MHNCTTLVFLVLNNTFYNPNVIDFLKINWGKTGGWNFFGLHWIPIGLHLTKTAAQFLVPIPRRPVLPGTVPIFTLVSQCTGNLLPGRPYVPFFLNSANSIFSFVLFLSRLDKTNQRRWYIQNIRHCIASRVTPPRMTGGEICMYISRVNTFNVKICLY